MTEDRKHHLSLLIPKTDSPLGEAVEGSELFIRACPASKEGDEIMNPCEED